MNYEYRDELGKALADVRKAHQLIFAFYKRIFDYANLIHQRLGFKRYYFHSDSVASHSLRNYGNLEVGHTAQFLPLALSNFLFLHPTNEENAYRDKNGTSNYMYPGDSMLVLQLIADSRLLALHQTSGSDIEGETYFTLWIIKNLEERNLNWYNGVFLKLKRRLKIPPSNSVLIEDSDPSGFSIYGEKWNLIELPDSDALTQYIDNYLKATREKLGLELTPT